jgi:hypothetical protein
VYCTQKHNAGCFLILPWETEEDEPCYFISDRSLGQEPFLVGLGLAEALHMTPYSIQHICAMYKVNIQ